MAVNTDFPEPDPPGPWIDIISTTNSGAVREAICVCSDHYSDYQKFRSGVSFGEAAQVLREFNQANRQLDVAGGDPQDPAGGYRSRGPVLWVMHVIKLDRWYLEHATCVDWDWRAWCEEHDDEYWQRMLAELEAWAIEEGVAPADAGDAADRIFLDGEPHDDVLYELVPGYRPYEPPARPVLEEDEYYDEVIPF